MASRFPVKALFFFSLLFGSAFFISPHFVVAGETHEVHEQLTDAIIDVYNNAASQRLRKTEREWIRWGVVHEGIKARALHHGEVSWANDSVQQSARVYEGIYTWEQGVYDAARGETQRAFEVLGHLLHLAIDAHPMALTARAPSQKHISPPDWRATIQEESERDVALLIADGAEMIRRFFREGEHAKEKPLFRPQTRTDIPTRALRRFGLMVREYVERFAHGIRVALQSVPPMIIGSIATTERETRVASVSAAASLLADAPVVSPVQVKRVEHFLPIAESVIGAAPTLLPLAQSIAPERDVVAPEETHEQRQEPESALLPQEALPPVPIEPLPLPVAIPTPTVTETPVESVPTLPLLELDIFGFPVGTHRTRDRIPPETIVTQKPNATTKERDALFVFAVDDSGTLHCTLDSEKEQECLSPLTYRDLAEGVHTFTVYARDLSNNNDPTPEMYQWMIDVIAPDTSVTESPLALTNNRTATFTLTASEGGATFHFTIDGSDWQPTPSLLTFTQLTDGQHTVSVRAIDAAGNEDETPVTYTWMVDTTAPTSPVLTSPTTGASYTTTAASVTIGGTRENNATVAVNDLIDEVSTPTETTWEKSIALALGETALTITARDAAGNVSAPLSLIITRTANQPPTAITNLAVTTPIVTNDRLTLTWTAPSDPDIPAQTLSYALRYATTSIADEATWSAATDASGLPAVGAGSAAETFTVTGLAPATSYFFALRTSDGELLSALSNSATGTTHYGVRITDAHFQGNASAEYMTIKNERSDAQNLQGWKLHDVVATPSHTYTFGVFTLAAGARVTVHTGSGVDTETDLYWNSNIAIWNDTGGDTAFLKDGGGMLIDSVGW